jgi:hypothetical protein
MSADLFLAFNPYLSMISDANFRCDECGRFIPLCAFESGAAQRRLVTPSAEGTAEVYETLCPDHRASE